MSVLTEGNHAGEFLISEGNGSISRDKVIIKSGEDLGAGALLGKITATGKYVEYDPAAADGSEDVAGILYDACDATDADTEAVMIARFAEVNAEELDYGSLDAGEITAVKTALAALYIFVREAI